VNGWQDAEVARILNRMDDESSPPIGLTLSGNWNR
jgi:hypothetical protein